jgi:hypothetical protein
VLASGLLLAIVAILASPASAQTPIPVPPGYATYCSVVYSGGAWDFQLGQNGNSDPCANLAKPGFKITRAGLWDAGGGAAGAGAGSGENNVLIRCDPVAIPKLPTPLVDRGVGAGFINKTVAKVKALKNCVVTVAPTALPIFSRPYGATAAGQTADADIDKIFVAGFNFDSTFIPWNASDFGQDLNKKGTAVTFDRFGRQQMRVGTNAECANISQPPGCLINSRAGSGPECATRGAQPGCVFTETFEPAYDWSMPQGKPLLAVAPGKVLQAWTRDVSTLGCKFTDKNQKEVYVLHQVGSGTYAEKFVTIYYHLDKFMGAAGTLGDTPPAANTELKRGQQIGTVGTTGCSGGFHVDFRVVRLTNLSGGQTFDFQVQPTVGSQNGYGSNGLAGHIDPFGWAAPKGIDPWAWRTIGQPNKSGAPFPAGITEFGAFSINLWLPLQAPPTYWTDFVPVFRQGDPGNGIGGFDLKSAADRAFAFDFNGSGKLDHVVFYRPGTGTIWILRNNKGIFTPIVHVGDPGNGIGGYDLKSTADRAFAFDFDGSGKLDHLVFYRPGTGTVWILKNNHDGTFAKVFPQGNGNNGIGGYDLLSPDDRLFAFDFAGTGKLDHIVAYRPGTGTIWILRSNHDGTFKAIVHEGAPGNGIGGFDLKSTADRGFAFDWDATGRLDHLAFYRPGTGTIWVLRNNHDGTFGPVLQQGDPGNGIGDGIGAYDLKSAADRVFAFDYDGTGKLGHLALYRPGTGTFWIMRNNQNATFDWVYQQRASVKGIGGYDLLSDRDRGFAFDFDGSGKSDHLVLYRPGTGTIWILKRENSG